MGEYKRIYIVGHPGAGKALVAKTLAKKLGWKFIDANFELEFRVGRTLPDALGTQGENNLLDCQSEILISQQKQNNIVVATDGSIVCSEKNRQLLDSEFVVHLKVSTQVQLERVARDPAPLLHPTELKKFLDKLHHERDGLYDSIANLSINTDSSELEKHVSKIADIVLNTEKKNNTERSVKVDVQDFIVFHKSLHTPVHLSGKQAACLKLLAEGKTSKEIADIMHFSYRTVEDYIAKTIELLGCASSKELIALYYDQP